MRVAVIDDDDDMRYLLRLSLAGAGCEVVTAADAAEATGLDWSSITAAVVDWRLPDDPDHRLAGWIAAAHPHVRPVVYTAVPVDAVVAPEGVQVVAKGAARHVLLDALGVRP